MCLTSHRKGLRHSVTWIDKEQITVLHPPVLLFRRFLSTLEGKNLFLSVRLVALAGDIVLPSDVEEWKRHFSTSCALTASLFHHRDRSFDCGPG